MIIIVIIIWKKLEIWGFPSRASSYAEWFSKLSYLNKYKDSTPNENICVQIQRLQPQKYQMMMKTPPKITLLSKLNSM